LIAADTNILVYAHREETPLHEAALRRVRKLAEGRVRWAIPVFCLGEFVRVVTHPRLFDPPSTLEQALDAVNALLHSPSLRVLMPGDDFIVNFAECARQADARGNLGYDAQIAALCLEHGVNEILTLDRDFARFPGLRVLDLD
jgi:hypothetical protein